VLEPILVKTVSRYTLSLENSKSPELGSVLKSLRQELIVIKIPIKSI